MHFRVLVHVHINVLACSKGSGRPVTTLLPLGFADFLARGPLFRKMELRDVDGVKTRIYHTANASEAVASKGGKKEEIKMISSR